MLAPIYEKINFLNLWFKLIATVKWLMENQTFKAIELNQMAN